MRKVRTTRVTVYWTWLRGGKLRGGCTCGWQSQRVIEDAWEKDAIAELELREHRATHVRVSKRPAPPILIPEPRP